MPGNVSFRHFWITRNFLNMPGDGPYLQVIGDDSQVDHNDFGGKKTKGNMLSVVGPGASAMAQRTWVHHNYFHDYLPGGGNGSETIRLGLSQRSLSNAFSLVEHNLFERTNGENEMISNKSSSNTYRYNTIRDTTGDLTLRHGNDCKVYGNYFLQSAGLRIFGDDHKIFSNYFGDSGPSITTGNGDIDIPPGPLTGHDRPERVTISFNTIINSSKSTGLAGRTNGLGATEITFSNNIIISDEGRMYREDGLVR